ncbi:MAG: hypothetical protein EOR51_34300 [Mesorhizobium sp.]|nr:MAG: hypothetical protein EOR51_34300 [Mesorhizobium sp.]
MQSVTGSARRRPRYSISLIQKMNAAAKAIADKNVCTHRSYRVWMRRQSLVGLPGHRVIMEIIFFCIYVDDDIRHACQNESALGTA